MSRLRALSQQALAVVAVLADSQEWHHGYDLMARAGVKSGTLYPLLMRLDAQGMLEARWVDSPEPGRPPRHVYKLTPAGRDWVLSLADSLAQWRAPSAALHSAKGRT